MTCNMAEKMTSDSKNTLTLLVLYNYVCVYVPVSGVLIVHDVNVDVACSILPQS